MTTPDQINTTPLTEVRFHILEEALEAFKKEKGNLMQCSPELQNNEDVVLAAIKKNAVDFKYASENLKNNSTFVEKALRQNVDSIFLCYSSTRIKSDYDIIKLAIELSLKGWEFSYAKGDAAQNKELAALALVKFGKAWGAENLNLFERLSEPLQNFFSKDSWLEEAKLYLKYFEKEKKLKEEQKNLTGGSDDEDGIIW